MQAQKEMPTDLQSKDKFLLQSVIAPVGSTPKDISAEMVSLGMKCCFTLYIFGFFINISRM